jgi:3-oxoacyl-[acyl-carrier-protein] synthase-1
MRPLRIRNYTATCAAGSGRHRFAQALAESKSGLRPHSGEPWPVPTWLGRVEGVDTSPLPASWSAWDCRATRLAWQALREDGFDESVSEATSRWGAHRIGLVLGTAASTIGVSEQAYAGVGPDGGFPPALASETLNTPHALAAFVQQVLGLQGPSLTISTACASSAQAFASGARWLALDLVDAVVVAGVDALCASTIYGFRSLGLVSAEPCQPFDSRRQGINLGEAAGFALLERGPGPLQLLGYGESNDAHHMSAPHPGGWGAERALDDALARAGVSAEAVELVSLHGTASRHNDDAEAALVARRYGANVHACATKGLTGHAMGAAGLLGSVVCWAALEQGLRAGTPNTDTVDPDFGPRFAAQLQLQPSWGRVQIAASHAFGFGGNNCVLVFGGAADVAHRAHP